MLVCDVVHVRSVCASRLLFWIEGATSSDVYTRACMYVCVCARERVCPREECVQIWLNIPDQRTTSREVCVCLGERDYVCA